MKKLTCYLAVWICFGCLEIFAQSNLERGFPAISNYSPKDYDAFRQNWVIAQDERGVMYFGNTDGLIEYDGSTWQLYTIPNKSAILGIAPGDDNKLYVGAQADLGYFFTDPLGKLTFKSLLSHIPEDKRDFTNVTETYVSQGKVYFNAEKYLLIWNIEKEEFEIVVSENGLHILFKANESIYAREWGVGLQILEGNTFRLLNGGELFANERIYSLVQLADENESLLIGTRTMGFFKYNGDGFSTFTTEIDQFIKENLIYLPGTVLKDGNILLNTLNGGSILIDQKGNELSRYNHLNGIINNTIYYSFQDLLGGIWLATENGIARIDYFSPVNYFDSRSKITTYSHDIIRHKGIIYAATANGVYSLDPKTSLFHQLENFNKQSYDFLEAEGDLLIGTADGLFEIRSDKLIPIKRTTGNEFMVNELIQSKVDPKRIYIGVHSGIWSMVKNGDEWTEEEQILEVNDQPTSLEEDKDGNLWMGTFSKGIFKVSFPKINNPLQIDPVIENFDKKNGIQDGITYAKIVDQEIYFATTDSIYQFDEKEKHFYIDTSDNVVSTFYALGAIYDRLPFEQDSLGKVWLGNKKTISVGEIKEDGKWEWNSFPFRRISDESIYSLYTEKNGITWFASGEGFIKYDFGKKENTDQNFSTLIRAVLNRNDSIISYGGQNENTLNPELKFNNNELKIRYTATNYERREANQFSTFLEGYDKEWSPWSIETQKAFTNLSPGEYTFLVKASNLLGIETEPASYSFVILPPWYRTWWAYLLYTLAISSLIYAIVQIRSYYLKKENRILEEKVQHRTRQLKKSLEDLKATQAQLIQSEKMASLGELTAGIAHEIQNPLNFVNNFSEVSNELIDEMNEEMEKGDIAEAKEISKDIKQNLEKINHHGKRADAIVKGMLQHSRSSEGKKEPTNINDLADEYLRLAYHGLRAKDKGFDAAPMAIGIKTDFDTSIPKVEVVPQDLGRVLLNLINNAFYAVAEKKKTAAEDYQPQVLIQTKKKRDAVEIFVKDNGNGIAENVVNKIFQPFFTTKPTGQGTGLGLSLSYDIIKAHGGKLEVETEEGQGSEFKISLPI